MKKQLLELLQAWIIQEGCSSQSALRDMLTDVRHLADAEKLDFHEALNGSYGVYLQEKQP